MLTPGKFESSVVLGISLTTNKEMLTPGKFESSVVLGISLTYLGKM